MSLFPLLRLTTRLRRLTHRNGYGVHSPFAYEFLTQVVYERTPFYAFPALQKHYPASHTLHKSQQLKCREFLFRLANYVHPQIIRIYGTLPQAAHDYLLAACLHAKITHETNTPQRASTAHQKELIIIAPDTPPARTLSLATAPSTPHSACLICGIYSSQRNLTTWQQATSSPTSAVTFDLYHFGLIFYDHTKPTQHYLINF